MNDEGDAKNRASLGEMEIRHRFGYHQPADEAATRNHRLVRSIFLDVANAVDRVLPEGRAKSTTMTKLEEALMWAQKAIAEMSPVVDE